ncbi:MAG: histidine phosphatase family protein [Nitrospirota bacterium]|nr:histidine phosphatase family protein [Nitrospirota bacterium]
MLPVTLWLIRHGQAETGGALTGHRDPPLAAAGHLQAADAAAALSGIPLAAVYCSDLQRSENTARAVAARSGGAPLETDPHPTAPHRLVPCADGRLRERHFGDWEGVSVAELQRSDPDSLARLWCDPRFSPPGGESFATLAARALACLGELPPRHPGLPIAVVTHGGVLRAVLADALGLDLAAAMRIEVAWGHAVLLQRFPDGGMRLVGVNLPPQAWGIMWHALEADDFRLTA